MNTNPSPHATIRDLRESDLPEVYELINEGFQIDQRFTTPSILHNLLGVYLHNNLLTATHARMAMMDGKPVGLLLGRVKGQPTFAPRARTVRRLVGNALRVLPSLPRETLGLKDFVAEHRTYNRMKKAALADAAPLNNELILFVVSGSTQGKGVGKALFEEFANEQPEFYLYTDDRCTWQFYEKRAMHRVAEDRRVSPITGNGIDYFIYSTTK